MKKKAIITGASSEIGQAISLALIESGWDMAIQYHQNQKAIEPISDLAKRKSTQFYPFSGDFRKTEIVKAFIEEAVDKMGGANLLINTIGPFPYRNILEVTPALWRETIDLNLNVTFDLTHYALPHLIKSKGHVINFTYAGVENIRSWPHSTDYCAAKAGVAILTKTLATQLGPQGVRVNAISPGVNEARGYSTEELVNIAKELSIPIPLERPSKSSEIAEVVLWLATESPKYLTGALIPIAGGWEY